MSGRIKSGQLLIFVVYYLGIFWYVVQRSLDIFQFLVIFQLEFLLKDVT
jgi:hypothetical protein